MLKINVSSSPQTLSSYFFLFKYNPSRIASGGKEETFNYQEVSRQTCVTNVVPQYILQREGLSHLHPRGSESLN